MSLAQLRRAWAAPVTSASQRLTLLALADFANDDGGECFPSQTTLARATCLGERTVRVVLTELRTLGLVVLERHAVGSTSARYRLSLPAVGTGSDDRKPPPPGNSDRKPDAPLPADSAILPAATAANPSYPSETLKSARANGLEAPRAPGARQEVPPSTLQVGPSARDQNRPIRPPSNLHDNAPRFPSPNGSAPGPTPGTKTPTPDDAARREAIERNRALAAAIAAKATAK